MSHGINEDNLIFFVRQVCIEFLFDDIIEAYIC